MYDRSWAGGLNIRDARATGSLGPREGAGQVVNIPHFAMKRIGIRGLAVNVEHRQEMFGVPTGELAPLGCRVCARARRLDDKEAERPRNSLG